VTLNDSEFLLLRITKKNGTPLKTCRFSRLICLGYYSSIRDRFRNMPAAKLTRTPIAIQIIQFDNGPVLKTNVSVQPKFAAKLQATNAYTDNTAGPINAATIAPNFWAVSAAHTPTRSKIKLLPCSTTAGQEREFSARIAIAVDLGSTVIEITF
jgi:hypothetical protein